ncbi:hypothetical protein Golob_025642 [Gossypium lobatum]|uniref:Uncharacterized protein n=1 Tax=Gossypium lobatum TaxID=34289 RepID=A0A7J8LSM5_9ROSI|nr:hypothetical protein [Gossypium lobatum]
MSSNMQRQTVPLSRSEKCIIRTGLGRQVALDSRVPAIADHEGKIISTDTDKIILSGHGDWMLTLHLAGRVSAKLPLILTAFAAVCKHPHTVWRSGVVRAIMFRDRIPSQQAFGTFPPFCKYDKQPATLLVTSPHVMAVVAMGSTTNMHNTRAQTSLRAAMGFSIEETMKLFWVNGEVF